MKVPKNKKTFLLISILQECILSCHFKSAINVFFWWWYLFKIIRCRRLDHRRVPSARRYGRNDHRAGWWPDNENPSRHRLPSRCCSPAKWLPASALHCKYFIKILIKIEKASMTRYNDYLAHWIHWANRCCESKITRNNRPWSCQSWGWGLQRPSSSLCERINESKCFGYCRSAGKCYGKSFFHLSWDEIQPLVDTREHLIPVFYYSQVRYFRRRLLSRMINAVSLSVKMGTRWEIYGLNLVALST